MCACVFYVLCTYLSIFLSLICSLSLPLSFFLFFVQCCQVFAFVPVLLCALLLFNAHFYWILQYHRPHVPILFVIVPIWVTSRRTSTVCMSWITREREENSISYGIKRTYTVQRCAHGHWFEITFLGFTALDIDNHEVKMSEYAGKVILFVNVASKWGLTKANYTQV